MKEAKNVGQQFVKAAAEAYKKCGIYLQQKLPLTNPVLMAMSALDPISRGHSTSCKLMKSLQKYVSVLGEELVDSFQLEVQQLHVDRSLSPFQESDRIDRWYGETFSKYPAVGKIMKACLSIFHGPKVESSFNTMGDIMSTKSVRMNVRSFDAVQIVKYLMAAIVQAKSHSKGSI